MSYVLVSSEVEDWIEKVHQVGKQLPHNIVHKELTRTLTRGFLGLFIGTLLSFSRGAPKIIV
jgi:hypothetical protein